MPITPPTVGQPDWGPPLNTALNTLESEVTTTASGAQVYTDTQLVAEVSRADGAYLHKTNNLSDLNNAAASRTNLGLGNSATRSVGTTSGTVAAGDDSRLMGNLLAANNLSDLTNTGTARTNLGLGNSAVLNVGTSSGTVAAGNDSRITGAEQSANKNTANGYAPLDGSTKLPTANLPNIPFANLPVGTTSTTVAVGNDSRITGAIQTGSAAGGDLTGTFPNPTLTNSANVQAIVRSARLDEMAAPNFNVPFNNKKITGLANGTAASDAAAFGQIPTTLPPTGSASGDLSGSYPGPTVAKVNGVSVTGIPTTGQVPTATSGTAATWQSPASTLPPSGPAGGDLIGTYPNPTLNATANVETIIRTNSLDQFAAPTTALTLNSKKIINLANGTASTDAAAFGQIPTTLPPSGSAGGDLAGTYPNPTVAATSNVESIIRANRLDQFAAPNTSVPFAGQKITALGNGTASSDAAAFGQIPLTLPPSGSAGGDLTGSYPNPTLGNTANVQSVVRSNRLDQMASPTASVSMNSQKITNLANGTVSSDGAAFGQIPTTLPPTGAAGGDLTGSYPGPTLANTANVQSVVRTNRLDQMAAPTAAVSMNNQKITNQANGTAASDSAAFGQIPTTLPPSGSAGGDLSSTYPNPTVSKVNGISASGTPSFGQTLVANTSSAATWQFIPYLFGDTGIASGAVMSFHSGQPTQFDISAGVGYIVDNVTTPSNPAVTKVTISAQTIDLTTFSASPAPTTRTVNWWLVNSLGIVVVQGTTPTNTQRRTMLILGVTGSVISTGVLFNVQPVQTVQAQPGNQVYDLMYGLAPFNVSGNIISANGANLSITKSAGTMFDASFNSATNQNDPHTTINPVETLTSFRNSTQTAGSQGSLVTTVDVTHYDVGGTVTLIPGGSGTATIQRVWLFGTQVATAQVAIQYGQATYTSLANAKAALGLETYIVNPDYTGIATLLAWIIVTKQCTSLQDANNALIVQAAKFAVP